MNDYDPGTTEQEAGPNNTASTQDVPSVDDIAQKIQTGLQRMINARKVIDAAEFELAQARTEEEKARAAAKQIVDDAQAKVSSTEKAYAAELDAVLAEGYVTSAVLASQGLTVKKRRGGRSKGAGTGQGTSVNV
ncbi:hypothetical protein [Rhodococcus sp. BS-15]|uniref:hypothetical protein n=1 Tax=Rhodococcus sp. BS-15 TaxID=1304954 RepID=UPI000B2F2FA9|nr:hypothetical protein [Rhodococcus sp. BS-15]